MRRQHGNNDNFFYQPVPSVSWNDDDSSRREMAKTGLPNSNNTNYFKQHLLMITLGMATGFLLGYDRNIATGLHKMSKAMNASSSVLLGTTGFRVEMSPLELLGELTLVKRVIFQKMVHEYGLYANLLAMDQDNLNRLFVISDESRKRFQRRILKKIVAKKLLSLSVESMAATPTDRFTWVTAGDMVAGGFGNRPEETYTAVLEETIRPVFAAVGIDFHARNQANVGYGSAPEMALCMNSLYHSNDAGGDDDQDVDVLSWDFSRTDGDRSYRASLWAAKATTHPSKPLLFMMAPINSQSWSEFAIYERRGMGVVLMNFEALQATQSLLPDSVREGSNPQELPMPLRNFICNGAPEGSLPCDDPHYNFACPIEGGEACRAQKFTKLDFCYQYGRYQANWVPGWKDHHLRGRLFGMFWMNIVQGSLLQLDALLESQDVTSEEERYLNVLQTIEDHERLDNFLLKNYPPPQFNPFEDVIRDFQLVSPAVNRTECFLMSAPPVASKGLIGESLLSTAEKIQEGDCELMKWDHREVFQVTSVTNEGESTNMDSTLEIFSTHQFEPLVQIAVCFQLCTLNEAGECAIVVQDITLESDQMKIKVNDVKVTKVREMDSCYFLAGANNGFHWELTSLSSYQLQFQVSKGSVLNIYSVITVQ